MELLRNHVQIRDNASWEMGGRALVKPDFLAVESREGLASDIPLGGFWKDKT